MLGYIRLSLVEYHWQFVLYDQDGTVLAWGAYRGLRDYAEDNSIEVLTIH